MYQIGDIVSIELDGKKDLAIIKFIGKTKIYPETIGIELFCIELSKHNLRLNTVFDGSINGDKALFKVKKKGHGTFILKKNIQGKVLWSKNKSKLIKENIKIYDHEMFYDACKCGDLSIVKYFIKMDTFIKGNTTKILNNNPNTSPFEIAIKYEHFNIINYILKMDGKYNHNPYVFNKICKQYYSKKSKQWLAVIKCCIETYKWPVYNEDMPTTYQGWYYICKSGNKDLIAIGLKSNGNAINMIFKTDLEYIDGGKCEEVFDTTMIGISINSKNIRMLEYCLKYIKSNSNISTIDYVNGKYALDIEYDPLIIYLMKKCIKNIKNVSKNQTLLKKFARTQSNKFILNKESSTKYLLKSSSTKQLTLHSKKSNSTTTMDGKSKLDPRSNEFMITFNLDFYYKALRMIFQYINIDCNVHPFWSYQYMNADDIKYMNIEDEYLELNIFYIPLFKHNTINCSSVFGALTMYCFELYDILRRHLSEKMAWDYIHNVTKLFIDCNLDLRLNKHTIIEYFEVYQVSNEDTKTNAFEISKSYMDDIKRNYAIVKNLAFHKIDTKRNKFIKQKTIADMLIDGDDNDEYYQTNEDRKMTKFKKVIKKSINMKRAKYIKAINKGTNGIISKKKNILNNIINYIIMNSNDINQYTYSCTFENECNTPI